MNTSMAAVWALVIPFCSTRQAEHLTEFFVGACDALARRCLPTTRAKIRFSLWPEVIYTRCPLAPDAMTLSVGNVAIGGSYRQSPAQRRCKRRQGIAFSVYDRIGARLSHTPGSLGHPLFGTVADNSPLLHNVLPLCPLKMSAVFSPIALVQPSSAQLHDNSS